MTSLQPSRKPMRRSATRRQRTIYGIVIFGQPCAYCQVNPAVNGDHVVPRALVRRYNATATEDMPSIPSEWLDVVPSCFNCNIRKGTRRLVPPSWSKHVEEMSAFFGGAPFRVWTGGTDEPAFKETHKCQR